MERLNPYRNRNVRLILFIGSMISIANSIMWVLTTFLIYGMGGSNSDLGRILGISTLIGTTFTFVASYLADHFRQDLVLVVIMLMQAAGVYLLISSNNLDDVFLGQVIYSAASSGSYPIMTAMFSLSIPSSLKNRVFGTNFLLNNLFSAGGGVIGYFALRGTDIDQVELIDVGLLKRIISISLYIFIAATVFAYFIKMEHTLSEADENEGATMQRDQPKDHRKNRWYHRIINPAAFESHTIKILLLSLVASYFIGMGAGISIPYLPRFFFDIYSIDLANLNLLFAGMTVVTAIWGKVSANLADRFGRNELIAMMQFVSVGLLLLLATVPPLSFAFMALIVRNAAMNGTGPLFSAIQMDYSPRVYRSQINAINSIAWSVFFSLGQILGGIMVDSLGFSIPFLTTATLYFLATLPFFRIKKLEVMVRINRRSIPLQIGS